MSLPINPLTLLIGLCGNKIFGDYRFLKVQLDSPKLFKRIGWKYILSPTDLLDREDMVNQIDAPRSWHSNPLGGDYRFKECGSETSKGCHTGSRKLEQVF